MKKIIFSLILPLIFSCNTGNSNAGNEKLDKFSGFWKKVNAGTDDFYQLWIIGKGEKNYVLMTNHKKIILTYNEGRDAFEMNGDTGPESISFDKNTGLLLVGESKFEKVYSYKKDGSFTSFNQQAEIWELKKLLAESPDKSETTSENNQNNCNQKETYIGKWKNIKDGGIMTIKDNGTNLRIKDDNGQDFTAVIKEDCTLQTTIMVGISYVKENGHLVWVNGEYEKKE